MTPEEIVAFYLDATQDFFTAGEVWELAINCINKARSELIKELMKIADN